MTFKKFFHIHFLWLFWKNENDVTKNFIFKLLIGRMKATVVSSVFAVGRICSSSSSNRNRTTII